MAKKNTGKTPDRRPARANYWTRGALKRHKVRNLVKFCRMTRADAERLWKGLRTKRIKGIRPTVSESR